MIEVNNTTNKKCVTCTLPFKGRKERKFCSRKCLHVYQSTIRGKDTANYKGGIFSSTKVNCANCGEEISKIFGFEVATIVEILTHRKGESYLDYIKRIVLNDDAVAIKIADICDNLCDSPSSHAIEKSAQALDILINK